MISKKFINKFLKSFSMVKHADKRKDNPKKNFFKIGIGVIIVLALLGSAILISGDEYEDDGIDLRTNYHIKGGICNWETELIDIDMEIENLGSNISAYEETLSLTVYIEDEVAKESDIDIEKDLYYEDSYNMSIEIPVEDQESVSNLAMSFDLRGLEQELGISCPGKFGDWQ